MIPRLALGRRGFAPTAGILAVVCLAFTACAEKVVDLSPPEDQPDGEPGAVDGGGQDTKRMPQPSADDIQCTFERDAKQLCALCYQREVLVAFECTEAVSPQTPDAGTEPEPPTPECFIGQDQRRCVFCPAGDGSFAVRGCLECKDPDATSMCQLCWWSDQSPERELCRPCEGSDGVSYATCDKLRPEPIKQMTPMR